LTRGSKVARRSWNKRSADRTQLPGCPKTSTIRRETPAHTFKQYLLTLKQERAPDLSQFASFFTSSDYCYLGWLPLVRTVLHVSGTQRLLWGKRSVQNPEIPAVANRAWM